MPNDTSSSKYSFACCDTVTRINVLGVGFFDFAKHKKAYLLAKECATKMRGICRRADGVSLGLVTC
jgi:hypothetical protein